MNLSYLPSLPAGGQRSLVDMAAENAVMCVVEMLEIKWATLLLLDDPAQPLGGYVRHRATRLPGGADYERRAHPEPSLPLWPVALASHEPIQGDAGADPINRRAFTLGVRTFLALSLHPSDGGAPLGILFLNRDHVALFDARERNTARRLATRIADMIARSRRENAWQAQLEHKRQEADRAHALLVREQAARAVAEAAQERLGFLSEVSAALATSLDYPATLQQVTRLAVPVLADWCSVNILEDDGTVRRAAAAHANPSKEELVQQLVDLYPLDPDGQQGPAIALRTGQARIVPDVHTADVEQSVPDPTHRRLLELLGVCSTMYVPLTARGRTFGVMSFVSAESRRRYGPADLALAAALGQRCALAIDNARLYQEAQEAVAARERFIAVASHELRTPITNINGFAQLLRHGIDQGGITAERTARYLDRLLVATQKLTRLTGELLDVSRLRNGKMALQAQAFDLSSRVRDSMERFAAQAPKHTLVSSGLDMPQMIVADINQVDQVVANLLENAVKYSPDGGEIRVSLKADNGGVLLRVQDHGIGLPDGSADAVFEPFDRGANAERLALPGLGLGLYICRTIAEGHGGRLWAESPGEGQGATMSLWLPRAPRGEQA